MVKIYKLLLFSEAMRTKSHEEFHPIVKIAFPGLIIVTSLRIFHNYLLTNKDQSN